MNLSVFLFLYSCILYFYDEHFKINFPVMDNAILLYCIVLYCIVLYCIVLYWIALYCIALHCIALYCIVLYCIVLYCIVLYRDGSKMGSFEPNLQLHQRG